MYFWDDRPFCVINTDTANRNSAYCDFSVRSVTEILETSPVAVGKVTVYESIMNTNNLFQL